MLGYIDHFKDMRIKIYGLENMKVETSMNVTHSRDSGRNKGTI
ncbi:Uncharacterized protein BM_BM17703 [Brugia malayi]|uniref:Uncharacterized protein n=1 Tax=Brugia malayi TaxID=6279 RepID=A0A4E9FKR5_BRUMA|nr:Uncharacterized protein BM_BM17703 [Brugia malayi]VIO97545.1 Uncharacterized protein BM_BM17703 [Brugia malayi]